MPDEKEKSEITLFAETNFHNKRVKFGIKTDDRRRHVYIIGKTGMGKTTLLENMIYSDIMAGRGVCYVDPHGDTAEKILNFIPKNRVNDVVYFNPADTNYPIAFNILEKVNVEVRHLIASGLVGVFKKLWAESWGPRLEYILRNGILALLDYPGSTLLGINRMFVDKDYRRKVIESIDDPVVKSFWLEEFEKYPDRLKAEAIAPIQNKVGQFLSTSMIRNIVGQVKSTIDIRKIMDDEKILILNLSKGRIGEDASALLGAMMITKIQLAAMSRVDTPEAKRKDFYLYVDEFQNFATDSFADILSEARKYRLNLNIAHQYIEQLGEKVAPAVFGNVGTIICFRVGAADAEELEKEFTPTFLADNLVNIPKFNIYLKLMIDGIASEPFSATVLPPLSQPQGNEDKIIAVCRERYAKEKDVVEDKIRRWSEPIGKKSSATIKEELEGITVDVAKKKQDDKKKPKMGDEPTYTNPCNNCGKTVETHFKPDPTRPIFCTDCLKLSRKGEIPFEKMIPAGATVIEETPEKVAKATPSVVEGEEKKTETGHKGSIRIVTEFDEEPAEEIKASAHLPSKSKPLQTPTVAPEAPKKTQKITHSTPQNQGSKKTVNRPRIIEKKPEHEKPASQMPKQPQQVQPGQKIII